MGLGEGKDPCDPAGVGDVSTYLNLNLKESDPNGAGNSFYDVAEKTGESVRVYTIDDFMRGDEVTLIKADIEGFELKMLQGAEETIKKWMPDLAICVYHRTPDIWEIPEYLKSIGPDYKFKLRHHHDEYSETVLYASVV